MSTFLLASVPKPAEDYDDIYLSVRNTRAGQLVIYNNFSALQAYVTGNPVEARKAAKFADRYGETLLIIAAANGFMQCLDLLLTLGPDLEAADAAGSTSLICAAEKGHVRIVRSLLGAGANPNHVNNKGDTPLLVACYKGLSLEVVQLLLAKKAEPLHRNKCLSTVLYVCVESDGPRAAEILKEIIDTLYRSGDLASQINLATRDLAAPIHCAAGLGRLPALRLLISNGADVNALTVSNSTPLMSAVERSAAFCVAELLKYNVDSNAPDHVGCTPLHVAVSHANLEIIDLLLRCKKSNVNARDNSGNSPLMVACQRLKAASVRELIGPTSFRPQDFDLGATNFIGSFPVFAVVEKSVTNEVVALEILDLIRVAMGDDEKFRKEINRMHHNAQVSPLFCACTLGASLVARRLIQYGADVAAQSRLGVDALFIAAQNGHEACVETLLREGKADPNVTKSDGATALIVAAENNYIRICQLLKKYGADMDARSSHGATPLWIACQCRIKHKSDDLIRFFLACGCSPHTCLLDNASCFFLLAEKNAPRASFELLLRACKGNEKHAKNMIDNPMKASRMTPLMVAVRQNCVAAAEYLLNIGASVTAKDTQQKSALTYAQEKKEQSPAIYALFTAEMKSEAKAKLRWDRYWKFVSALPTKIVSRFYHDESGEDGVVVVDPEEETEDSEKKEKNSVSLSTLVDPLKNELKAPNLSVFFDVMGNDALHSVLVKTVGNSLTHTATVGAAKEIEGATSGDGRRRQREE